ncbi:MAG: hypothetical protein GWM92_04260, partial [Gemmatimonadetes bacterium]|nr:hypothetical protein [Gemmatimonadota bacterium]NIR77774.1 hypothetical protein [Gemmatimonadota bacterium]NIT86310.1 hypothetical protein [Gemmatimonadota bacterium]NIU30144.1 hypothetical protein [Gemmatimonadota bacterium]NIU35084.1 hypothetical protein [Gemmatimonadota bacterium]
LLKVPRVRGPLKERTFNIPDEEIEDFLESNVMEVTARYVRTMAGDLVMKRFFGRPDPGEEIARGIVEEAAEASRKLKDPKARRTVQARAEREAELVQDLVDLLRGTNRRPADPRFDGLFRVLRTARNLNFVRLLGKVVISQIPDFGKLIIEEGTARVFGTTLAEFGRGFRGVRMAKNEAQLAGTALDTVLATRARAALDLGDRLVNETAFERAVDELAQGFGTAVGLNPYNVAVKSLTSTMVSTRILKTVEKIARGGSPSRREAAKLAKSG